MSVLECANKLLEILTLNDLPPKLRWRGEWRFKIQRLEGRGRRQQETTEHRDNIALPCVEFILHRGKHTCSLILALSRQWIKVCAL